MDILAKFLIWMEERFGRFLLPVEFNQQDTPKRGYKFKLPTPAKPVKVPLGACCAIMTSCTNNVVTDRVND